MHARLLTAAWAMTEAITRELEAQGTQKEMLLVLLYAEGIEGLSFGCWCGAGRVARAAASVGSGRYWAGERESRDAARVRTLECFGFVWRLLLWRACAVAPCSCAFVRDPCMGR